MQEVHLTLLILWVIARVTENRRLETIVKTQTNATKTHLHEGRMLRHYSSMVSLRAAVTTKGRHQQTSSLRQHQRYVLAATHCPCAVVAALQVAMQRAFRNKTLLTKRRASSRHSRSAKGQISSKHAGELKMFSGENLRKDLPKTLTATRSCTLRSLFAHRS